MRLDTFGSELALALLLSTLGASSAQAQSSSDDFESQLSLADLTAYHAALSGKATADNARASDPPLPVSFRDLWSHSDMWRGRRVLVKGKIARVFHQGAVGSFPPLAQAWLSTPAGDILCIVFPQGPSRATMVSLEPGEQISFTGTFLKSIRYPAADQARLAPLIVGDQQPDRSPAILEHDPDPARAPRVNESGSESNRDVGRKFESWSPMSWELGLTLGLVAAAVLAWQHLRGPMRTSPSARPQRGTGSNLADPPLEFLETEPVNGPAVPDKRSP